MKWVFMLLFGLAAARAMPGPDEMIERIDQALTFSTAGEQIRGRLSGTFDFETYYFRDGDPGLIYSGRRLLLNPRFTFFLDAQLGSDLYVFVQTRIDRGFDPSQDNLQIRLDEYALRYTPWRDGHFQFQIGKFATVVGNWVERHLSWDNPFIGAPLPYEQLTAMWDSQAAGSFWQLRAWAHMDPIQPPGHEHSDKRLRLPIIWGPSYTTGAAVSGKEGYFEYAAEFKNASLSSRPEEWDAIHRAWENPTISGRIGYRPNPAWNFGLSASEGSYLDAAATNVTGDNKMPDYSTLRDYRQIVLAQDLSFAWHHLQIWAEAFESRFQSPKVGNADVYSYYVETKYKFTPQFFGALRWNQEWYGQLIDSEVKEGPGHSQPWGRTVSRIDLAGIYRLTENAQLKLQFSFLRSQWNGPDNLNAAMQFTVRF